MKYEFEISESPAETEPRSKWGIPRKRKARVYVWIKDESMLGNFVNRRSRPARLWKREIVLPALNALGIDLEKVDLKWSQKAGCNCGCSPAFIDHSWTLKNDISITVNGAPEVKQDTESLKERLDRFAAITSDPTLGPLFSGKPE